MKQKDEEIKTELFVAGQKFDIILTAVIAIMAVIVVILIMLFMIKVRREKVYI